MSIKEQKEVKQKYYAEAMRYMDNAKETLKKAGKEGKYYQDEKYVKTASGIAYNGVLKALDGYLMLKGIKKEKGRKSIEWYQSNIGQLDRKLNSEMKAAYDILNLSGYYDGNKAVPVIQTGFEVAYDKRIEP